MSLSLDHPDVNSSYQSSLSELIQAIEWGQGQFSLILAHCNSPSVRKRALQDLEHCETFPLHTVSLQPDAELMFSSISIDLQHLDSNSQSTCPAQPFVMQNSDAGAIAISGFEEVNHIDTLLSSADTVREELRKVFHCPLVWWMSDDMLVKLIRIAPNIHSWFTFVEFLSEPESIEVHETGEYETGEHESVCFEPELTLLTNPRALATSAYQPNYVTPVYQPAS